MRILHTLKFKLALACFSMTVLLSLVLYVILHRDSRSTFFKEQTDNISHELSTVSDELDSDISSIRMILYFVSNESSVRKLLTSSHPIGAGSIQLNKTLQDKLKLSSLYPYVNKLLLSSQEVPVVTIGAVNGMPDDYERLKALPYLDVLVDSPTLGAVGIVDEPLCCYQAPVRTIPLACTIPSFRRQPAGLLYLSLSPDIILDKTKDFSSLDDAFLYLKMNEHYYRIFDETFVLCQEPPLLPEADFIPGVTLKTTATFQDVSYDAVISTLSTVEWSLIQLIDPQKLPLGILLPSYPLILSITVFTFLLLLLLMHLEINRPVKGIARQLDAGAEDPACPYPSPDYSCEEFREISRGIERMRERLNSSFRNILKAEQGKRELEFKVLQYQINPHFISNSLNTIKWMADIQGSYGIGEMTAALSNLFCNVIRNDTVFVSFRQELAMLRDYITIQRYRYKDIFTYEEHIEDPTLYDASIMKFTLQPVVENAIFHGIASGSVFGIIRLSVIREHDDVVVQIFDNGKGMSASQIDKLFMENVDRRQSLNKIGIRNIDERLKMEYGDSYRISIESLEGEYTLVTIRYPDRRRDNPCTNLPSSMMNR